MRDTKKENKKGGLKVPKIGFFDRVKKFIMTTLLGFVLFRLIEFAPLLKKIVPFIGGVFSDKTAYSYLPRSVVYLPEEKKIVEMIEQSGFSNVKKFKLTGGIAQLLIAEKQKD